MKRIKTLETCLVITTGFIVLWFIYKIKIFLVIALIIGFTGVFLKKPAEWINWLWYKLADILGYVVSKIVLSVIFFVFLFPIAMVYKLFNKDSMKLANKYESYFTRRNIVFKKDDLKNIW